MCFSVQQYEQSSVVSSVLSLKSDAWVNPSDSVVITMYSDTSLIRDQLSKISYANPQFFLNGHTPAKLSAEIIKKNLSLYTPD